MWPGLDINNRYRLQGQAGHGGWSDVWRAWDRELNRPVAIKVLRPPLNSDRTHRKRLEREAETVARLKHPGITVLYDICEHNRQLCIVMEWLDGSTFDDIIHQHTAGVSVAQALSWGRQIADALSHAHRSGIVHRDVKPPNLMLVADDWVKVCDFGIAKSAEATTGLTPPGGLLGTPAFMSPEQWTGEDVDHRTDLYGLGCVLYALLTGHPPFRVEGSPYEFREKHLYAVPKAPKDIRADIPAELDMLVLELLAKDPANRPDDAATVARRLDTIAARSRSSALAAAAAGRPRKAPAAQAERSGASIEQPFHPAVRAYVKQLGLVAHQRAGGSAGRLTREPPQRPSTGPSPARPAARGRGQENVAEVLAAAAGKEGRPPAATQPDADRGRPPAQRRGAQRNAVPGAPSRADPVSRSSPPAPNSAQRPPDLARRPTGTAAAWRDAEQRRREREAWQQAEFVKWAHRQHMREMFHPKVGFLLREPLPDYLRGGYGL